jgi:hypothetical protein
MIVFHSSGRYDSPEIQGGNTFMRRRRVILAVLLLATLTAGIVFAATTSAPASKVAPKYANWEGVKNKWVPILDVSNNGIRVGAAQVAGPEGQVNQCKAVALLGLSFKSVARIKTYIPIDSYNVTQLNRIQGVSVWATGDLKIVRF